MLLLLLACSTPAYRNQAVITGLPDFGEDPVVDPEDTAAPYVDPGSEPWQPDPEAPAVLINELVAGNDSTWAGRSDTWPDWVELYNASDEVVNLADLVLRDSNNRPWQGGAGGLEPGGRVVIEADGSTDGGYSAPFHLGSGGGDRLVLEVDGYVSDRIAFGELPTDVAWGRYPDGGDWAPSVHTTPGAANDAAPSVSLDPRTLVFQIDDIPDLNLRLSAAALASLRASRLTYVDGGLDVPEGDFGDVQTKLKSYVGSSRTIDQKCAWKLDVNDENGRDYHGLGKLTLNNMVQDNTYIHEFAAYELFRAVGVPAPRVGYARVAVNGTDYGLYLQVETIDHSFLEEWFGDSSGNLYEGAYGVDLYGYYVGSYDFKGGEGVQDRSDLQAVVDVLDDGATEANYTRIRELVDMDEFLANMAVEGLIMHWDGYSTANNYRLYADPKTGKFVIIPWGADQTFLTAYFTPWTGRGRLFQWCLSIETCAADYDRILWDATVTMDSLDLATQVADLEAWLRGDIGTDPRREFDLSTHDYYLSATEANMRTYPQTVRDEILAR